MSTCDILSFGAPTCDNTYKARPLNLSRYYAKKLKRDGFIDVPIKKLLPGNLYTEKSKTKQRIYKV